MKKLIANARDLWAAFSDINAGTFASSISYYTFMSIVPLLAICISLISLTGVGPEELSSLVHSLIPEALYELVDSLIEDAFARSGIALSVSSLTLLWSASKGAKALRAGLNSAYAERETRNFVQVTIISIVAVIILGVLLSITLYLIFGDSVLHALAQHIPTLDPNGSVANVIDMSLAIGGAIIGFDACYTFLPAGKRKLASQLPGAICATIACGVLAYGFRIYVDNFANYTVLYGSFATVSLFLFWMFLTFNIILAGGFFNRMLWQTVRSRKRTRPETHSA